MQVKLPPPPPHSPIAFFGVPPQGWYETLRVEGYEHNIEVTLICPGPVFSNLLETAFTDSPGKVSQVPVILCVYV